MAGRGPAPKPADERVRRNADVVDSTEVIADGEMRGPALPDVEGGWPALTRSWWDAWRRAPQASLFTETDWQFLIETALLHAQFVRGSWALAAEVRLRVAKFGATPEDRLRLRLSVTVPPPAPAVQTPDEVASKRGEREARRARLAKAADGD